MDPRVFDRLTRTFGLMTSRRAAIRGIIGVAAGVAIGTTISADDSDAAHSATCTPAGARCAHHADCCGGVCVTQVVRRGRQKVRVGTCAAAPEPTPFAPASCDPPNGGVCVTSPSTTFGVCGQVWGSTADTCSRDSDCSQVVQGCGSTYTCVCETGRATSPGAYIPAAGQTYCFWAANSSIPAPGGNCA